MILSLQLTQTDRILLLKDSTIPQHASEIFQFMKIHNFKDIGISHNVTKP